MNRVVVLSVWVVAAALVAWTGFSLGKTLWHVAGYRADPVPLTTGLETPRFEPRADIDPLLTWAPFGERYQPAEIPGNATTLASDLTLAGVLVAVPDTRSWAAISINSDTETVFFIGEQIAGRYELAEVHVNFVVLTDLSGTRVRLEFPDPALNAPSQTGQLGVSPQIANARDADTVIDIYRRRISSDPSSVLSELGVSSTDRGYLVGQTPPQVVRRAGLQAGDRILSVNGNAVGNVNSDRALFEDIVASGRARVEIERNGRTILLSFPIR